MDASPSADGNWLLATSWIPPGVATTGGADSPKKSTAIDCRTDASTPAPSTLSPRRHCRRATTATSPATTATIAAMPTASTRTVTSHFGVADAPAMVSWK